MRVLVRPMFREGRALPRGGSGAPAIDGELQVREERDHELSRSVLRARLLAPSGTEHDLLPELTDAQLLAVEAKRMRLAGVEYINGAGHAQTWAIEVA